MLVVFNGTAHPLRNFTVSDWRQRSSASCGARCRPTSDERARGNLWWGEHIKTNGKLRVSIRTDRKQLLSLYEGPRQILQCTVDHFDSFDQCAEVLIGFAEHYAAGHVQADDLQRERDAQMVARGIAAPAWQEVCCQPGAERISTETEARRHLRCRYRFPVRIFFLIQIQIWASL